MVATPGALHPHSPTTGDRASTQRGANVTSLVPGGTTVVTNNDGSGPIDIAKTLDAWQRDGIGTNAALYVPQGDVRRTVLGIQRRD